MKRYLIMAMREFKVDSYRSGRTFSNTPLNVRMKPERLLECPVCYVETPDAESQDAIYVQIAPCGHVLCHGCVETITRHPYPKCPNCRGSLNKLSRMVQWSNDDNV